MILISHGCWFCELMGACLLWLGFNRLWSSKTLFDCGHQSFSLLSAIVSTYSEGRKRRAAGRWRAAPRCGWCCSSCLPGFASLLHLAYAAAYRACLQLLTGSCKYPGSNFEVHRVAWWSFVSCWESLRLDSSKWFCLPAHLMICQSQFWTELQKWCHHLSPGLSRPLFRSWSFESGKELGRLLRLFHELSGRCLSLRSVARLSIGFYTYHCGLILCFCFQMALARLWLSFPLKIWY